MMKDDNGQTEWEKENDPKRWMSYTFHTISNLIDEYNEVAIKEGTNLISAFSMTHQEYKETFGDAENETDRE